MNTEDDLLAEMLAALSGVSADSLRLTSSGGLSSAFPVSELATTSISAAALAAAHFAGGRAVTVDRRLASAWFASSIAPEGWSVPPAWDPIAGDYETSDGWIRLHTNAERHRAAALTVLGCAGTRAAVSEAVSAWRGQELETAVVEANGCAAVMQSAEQWFASTQGQAVAAEPLIAWQDTDAGTTRSIEPSTSRPLRGVRVLDLTRILAGPVATRFLALLGADVLRIDPVEWEETLIPEVALGKRTSRLDLTRTDDRATLTELLSSADIIVHGYRPGALESLGFGQERRQQIRPGLIDISLDAYGWSGPMTGRRGFDSLVQMTTGIAHAGMVAAGAARPVPLPVQALDHATGYLLAAAALSALDHRGRTGHGRSARLSLARTATLLLQRQSHGVHEPFADISPTDFGPELEETSWGPARRLRQPVTIEGVDLAASPAHGLGHDAPRWW